MDRRSGVNTALKSQKSALLGSRSHSWLFGSVPGFDGATQDNDATRLVPTREFEGVFDCAPALLAGPWLLIGFENWASLSG